jgi:hypothetical protein
MQLMDSNVPSQEDEECESLTHENFTENFTISPPSILSSHTSFTRMFTEATVNHSVASLALGIATCVIAVGLLKAKSSRNYDDILEVVLTKTAPNAASEQLKDCLTCERKLNGVNLVITKGEL